MPTTTSDAKYAKLNALLSQTSAYSEFLINKVPEKLRKQLTNTTSKVSSSFEMDGDEKDRKKIE
eukprot:266134-Amorphochlora_amoeboformis.AAC.2